MKSEPIEKKVYKRDNGETFTINELIRTEWAKANELHKLTGWKRMFSNDYDLLSRYFRSNR